MKDLLRLENVHKQYTPTTGVKEISMSFQKGKCYGLIGMNGAGKTTIIHLILNKLRANEGSVYWKGEEVKKRDYLYKQNIGYVPDDNAVFEMLTITEIAEFVGTSYNVSLDTVRSRLAHLLNLTELEENNQLVGNFSRGMKKKVQFISAIISKPECLILDEPIAGLDPNMIYKLRRFIKEYVRKNDTTAIISTHDLPIAQDVCDYIYLVHKGELLYQASMEEIVERFGSLEQAFLQKTDQPSIEEQLSDVVSNI